MRMLRAVERSFARRKTRLITQVFSSRLLPGGFFLVHIITGQSR